MEGKYMALARAHSSTKESATERLGVSTEG